MPSPNVLESSIERSVVTWARNHGIQATKLQGIGNRSMPDRIFWVNGGKPILVEFKSPNGKLTPLQRIAILKFTERGYEVHVISSREEGIAVLAQHV